MSEQNTPAPADAPVEEAKVVTITPTALAKELDIDPKRVRAYLRKEFTRPGEAKNTSWDLTPETANATREHFTAKRS